MSFSFRGSLLGVLHTEIHWLFHQLVTPFAISLLDSLGVSVICALIQFPNLYLLMFYPFVLQIKQGLHLPMKPDSRQGVFLWQKQYIINIIFQAFFTYFKILAISVFRIKLYIVMASLRNFRVVFSFA